MNGAGLIPVVASLDPYRVGVSGLPIRARLASEGVAVAGAIVVVDGAAAWWDAAAAAVDAGASAVLVTEPREEPIEHVTALLGTAAVPIVVFRARLRHDLVDQAVAARDGEPPRIVVAEARGSATELRAIVRDAVGWVRALGGARLEVASAAATARGGTVLLRSRDDGRVIGSLILAASEPRGELLRVRALGETATEVEIDEAMGRWEVATSTAVGRTIAPTRFEERERAALRRAVEAVAS
ncbi:MAG: hypothetical protein HOQ00_01890 [Agromyces sp.]|nr:hypothetical protein [Agromyces sp.]